MKPYWALALSAFVLVVLSSATAWGDAGPITLVFRYDDYSSGPRHNSVFETQLLKAFIDSGMAVTYGVIPVVHTGDLGEPAGPDSGAPLTIEEGSLLLEGIKSGHLEVAMHGFSHRTNRVGKTRTEFEGLPLEEQRSRLARGKAHLERLLSIKVDTFIPPWNQYDANTLLAVEDLGFSVMSADIRAISGTGSSVTCLPCTCAIGQVRGAIAAARAVTQVDRLIVVLFHAYDFVEVDRTRGNTSLQELGDLLRWIRLQEGVDVVTLKAASLSRPGMGQGHLNDLCAVNKMLQLVPAPWRPLSALDQHLYPDVPAIDRMRWIAMKWCLFWYGAVGLGASIGTVLLLRFSCLRRVKGPLVGIALLILIGLIFAAIRDGAIGARGATLVVLLSSGLTTTGVTIAGHCWREARKRASFLAPAIPT
jgi:hypothetical protein